MGIISRIFNSSSAVEEVTKGVASGVDKVWYTDEEKAEGFVTLLKTYEPFKLAQRLIALVTLVPFVGIWVLSALMFLIGGAADSESLMTSAKTLGTLNVDTLGTPVAFIVAFYYGGGAVEGVVERMMTKRKAPK